MILIGKVLEVCPKTSFDGREGKVDVQPIILQSASGQAMVEIVGLQVMSFEQQKIAVGDLVSLEVRLKITSFESQKHNVKAYITHLECSTIFKA